jgi:hypothetical protein
MRGNPDNLRQAAARKSAAAQTRAEQGLREMIRRNEPITFRGLAQTAGVSLDFLYHCAPIRHRVEHLRAQQQTTPPPAATTPHPDTPSSVVRTLTAQLTALKQQHRDEVHQLRQASKPPRARSSNCAAASATAALPLPSTTPKRIPAVITDKHGGSSARSPQLRDAASTPPTVKPPTVLLRTHPETFSLHKHATQDRLPQIRCPHNVHYVDLRIMPTSDPNALVAAVSTLTKSA